MVARETMIFSYLQESFFKSGTWLRDTRNWNLHRGTVCVKHAGSSPYTCLTWVSQSPSPSPKDSSCTNAGVWVPPLLFSLLRTMGPKPSLVSLEIFPPLSERHQDQHKRAPWGISRALRYRPWTIFLAHLRTGSIPDFLCCWLLITVSVYVPISFLLWPEISVPLLEISVFPHSEFGILQVNPSRDSVPLTPVFISALRNF